MRFFVFVINGFGIGNLCEVASQSLICNTYEDINKKMILNLTNLKKMGIDSINGIKIRKEYVPLGSYGKASIESLSKGLIFDYLELFDYKQNKIIRNENGGLSKKTLKRIERKVGLSFLCNKKSENIKAIEEFGNEHLKTGKPILSINEDNIIQVSANLSLTTKERLYEIAEIISNNLTLLDGISKVIARPFYGSENHFVRTLDRKDFLFKPNIKLKIDKIAKKKQVIMLNDFAKIFEKFKHIKRVETKDEEDAKAQFLNVFNLDFDGVVFCNVSNLLHLGKKHDVLNYGMELEKIDKYIYDLVGKIKEGDNVIIMGNHSANPTISSFQTGIEFVPILAIGDNIEKNCNLDNLKYDEIVYRILNVLEGKKEKF